MISYNYVKPLIISGLFIITLIFHSCKPEDELTANKPVVITKAVTNITDSSAVSGGNIISSGASYVTQRGVCWSISPNPTVNNNKTLDGSGAGNYTSNITGLESETYYYVRAYATNSIGTDYGSNVKFYATSMPVVTTADITNITSYSAVCGGNVISDGGSSISMKGVCWATKPNPTINDYKTNDGNSTGEFVSNIIGLKEDTVYYVRAYAKNQNGYTGYGEERSFKPVFVCGQDFRDNRDGHIYTSVLIGNQCWMKQNLNYGEFVNSTFGQSAVGTQKFCYNNNIALCEETGGMYVWDEVMNGETPCNGTGESQPQCTNLVKGICPDGWHIPSHYEWTVLEKLAGNSPDQFPYDEITTGWLGTNEGDNIKMNGSQYWGNEGTNLLGFNGLGGGYYMGGQFKHYGERGKWWTCSEADQTTAWHRGIQYGFHGIYRFGNDKEFGYSLRCIKNK